MNDKKPLSLKYSLIYSCSLFTHPYELKNNTDPILKLITNYEDILTIIKNNEKGQITKLFYFNKKKYIQFYSTAMK